jgi:type II secretory pathway component GspD/PulD (secretin)
MNWLDLRHSASLLFATLLVCLPICAQEPSAGPTQAPSQTQAPTRTQAPAQTQTPAPQPYPTDAQLQLAPRPDPKYAKKLTDLGDKELADGRLDEALNFYQQAVRFAPQDTALIEHIGTLRSKLVRDHVETAERDALAGHADVATEELAKALFIDPGNTVVAQRLSQMKAMNDGEITQSMQKIEGLVELKPLSKKQNLNLRGDTKTVYEQMGAMFGIKVTFDPDLPARPVQLRLDDADFDTALKVMSLETATFSRPLTTNLLFVAQDTAEKHRQYEVVAEQTFMLPASVSNEEMADMVRLLRDLTGATHIELNAHSRAVTIRDTPARLALAHEVINQAEKARGEVLLEMEILEVDRNKATELGISPPSSVQAVLLTPSDLAILKASTDLANLLTNLSTILTATGLSNTTSLLPIGGGLSTFLLSIPSTAANFSDTLSLVKSGRQVLLRAQDGKAATFFVGDRYPITLSLLSSSLGATSNLPSLSGTTFPETSFPVGKNPSSLVGSVSFSGGSLPDLAVVNRGDNTISIYQNQDLGNFVQLTTSPISMSPGETGPVAIATGVLRNNSTFNTAQPSDLVVVNATSNNISILLGNVNSSGIPNGTFTEATGSPIPVGKNPSAVWVADFNGDGFLDIAVANQADNTISLFRGNGDGTFTAFPGSPFALTNTGGISEQGPVAMVGANFRNDTISTTNSSPEVDLAVVNQTSNNVTILLSSVDDNQNVTFTEAAGSPIGVGNLPVAIATGDVNADGVPDLAIVNQSDATVTVLLGSASLNATFTAATGSPLQTATTPAGIVIANFAGGTVPDIAVTNEGVSTLGLYVGEGEGTFSSRIELNVPTGPMAMITSTLSSSGLPDVAFVAQDSAATDGVVAVVLDSSSFLSAAGGVGAAGQEPYPGAEYEDIGVKVKATPTMHPNDEVTLQLDFEIRALAGSSINGIPVITNRTISQTLRIKEEETTMISGLLDNEETKTLSGLPGFANIPVARYLFAQKSVTAENTEMIILVTPHPMRLRDRVSRSIYAGRGDSGGAGGRGSTPSAPAPRQP